VPGDPQRSHGGLDSIDPDQGLASTLGSTPAPGLDTDMMAQNVDDNAGILKSMAAVGSPNYE
jgi:hypothetical protein